MFLRYDGARYWLFETSKVTDRERWMLMRTDEEEHMDERTTMVGGVSEEQTVGGERESCVLRSARRDRSWVRHHYLLVEGRTVSV